MEEANRQIAGNGEALDATSRLLEEMQAKVDADEAETKRV